MGAAALPVGEPSSFDGLRMRVQGDHFAFWKIARLRQALVSQSPHPDLSVTSSSSLSYPSSWSLSYPSSLVSQSHLILSLSVPLPGL
jgi:hypothetical protein